MQYDFSYFDEVVNRRKIHSGKWDGLEVLYGNADLVPMWVADTDFRAPKEVIDAIVARAQNGTFGYSLIGSMFKNVPIAWQKKRNQIDYSPESTFFINNVVVAMSTAVRALTKEGDNVLVATPTYGPFIKTPLSARRKVITSKLQQQNDKYVFDFADIEEKIRSNDVKMFILCNPHNPTGRVWTQQELTQLLEICKKYNVIVVSDEIHSDLLMPGQQFVPAMKVAREINYAQNMVIASAPTKTFNLAGIQVAYYFVENPVFIEKMNEERDYCKNSDLLGAFAFWAIQEAYAHGAGYVDTMTQYLQANFNYLKEQFAARCPEATVINLESTYLAWVDLRAYKNIDNQGLRKEMIKYGTAIQAGNEFFEEDNYIRINIACPRKTLEAGVNNILNCLEALK